MGGDVEGLWAQIADINKRLRELTATVQELNALVYEQAGLTGKKQAP